MRIGESYDPSTKWGIHRSTFTAGALFLAGTAIAIYLAQKFLMTKRDTPAADLNARAKTTEPTNLVQWFLSFFQDPPIDSALFAQWDRVVEKEYDPIGASAPFYTELANEGKRGKKIADHFVKAVSKTGHQPSFKHILITEYGDARIIFKSDLHYDNLAERAKAGEFSGNDTLIVICCFQLSRIEQGQVESWRQAEIHAGYPVENTKIVILNSQETSVLRRDQLPSSLRKILTS